MFIKLRLRTKMVINLNMFYAFSEGKAYNAVNYIYFFKWLNLQLNFF